MGNTMDIMSIIQNPLVLVVATAVVAILLTRWSAKQPPSKLAQTVEEDAFALLVKGIQKLADTSGHDASIAAAQQAKAIQLAQLDHARTVLNGIGAAPQAPGQQQPPAAQ